MTGLVSNGGSGSSGVPSIAGTTNQINQSGSPGATTLSLSSTIVTPGSISLGGAAGLGFFELTPQSVTPAAPAANTLRLYSSAAGVFRIEPSNGFSLGFVISGLTASRNFALPDLAGTFALTANNLSVFATGGAIAPTTVSIGAGSVLTSPTTASLQFGAADVDTGPVTQTLRTQGALAGGTSNVAGVNFTVIVSPGKGTGAGGSFIVQTAPAGSTGTVVGTPTTALTIDSTKLATFAGLIKVSGDTTGAGITMGFGTNSPATTLTAPYTWLKFISSDGSTVYVAGYK